MKDLKWLFLGMVVLALVASEPTWAQCTVGITVDIEAEYQGTDTQAGVGLDETHPAGPTVVDYIVTVSVGGGQCPVERGEVWLTLPDGTLITLADKTLELNPGESEVYDVNFNPYAIDSGDLNSLPGAEADEVRATAEVNVVSIRTGLPPQDAQGEANWDITVIFPEIDIEKSAEPNNICEGGETLVTYTYLVSWGASGNVNLEDVVVTDDECSPVERQLPDPCGNSDDILEEGEIWVYECNVLLTEAMTNTATVGANDIWIATHVTDEDTAEVFAENPVCEDFTGDLDPNCDSTGNTLSISATGGVPPYGYSWTSSDANWPITGGADTNTITYDAGPPGSSTWFCVDINDALDCNVQCCIEIDCPEVPGDTFCSFTQGFWGNAGGKYDGNDTLQLLIEYFTEETYLMIGDGNNSVTLWDANCVLDRLPAGGEPRCLEGLGNVDDDCGSSASDDLEDWLKSGGKGKGKGKGKGSQKSSARYNNVLMGQVIALTLNMWLDGGLGSFELPEGYFCVQPEEEGACAGRWMIPQAILDAGVETVAELLDLANDALDECDSGVSISDIYNAVTTINEAFDECGTVIECPETETDCDDGCDNDFDTYFDCDDIDCAADPCCVT